MKRQKTQYSLTDHCCRTCCGRILQQETNVGVTGGGNPLFRCANCGVSVCEMSSDPICWCGFSQRRDVEGAYICCHKDELEKDPILKIAAQGSGFQYSDSEVGFFSRALYKSIEEKYFSNNEQP